MICLQKWSNITHQSVRQATHYTGRRIEKSSINNPYVKRRWQLPILSSGGCPLLARHKHSSMADQYDGMWLSASQYSSLPLLAVSNTVCPSAPNATLLSSFCLANA